MATRKYEVKVSSVGLKEVIGEFKDLNSQMKTTTSTANKLPASMQQIIRSSRAAATALEALNKQIDALNRKTVSIKVDMAAATAAMKKVVSVDAKVKNIVLPTKKTVIEAVAEVSAIKLPKALKNLELTANIKSLNTKVVPKSLDFKGNITKLDLVDKKAPLTIKSAVIQKIKLADDMKEIKLKANIDNIASIKKQLEKALSDVGVNIKVNTRQATARDTTAQSRSAPNNYTQMARSFGSGDAESYKNLQGIAQASSNATKNFAKMNAEFSPLVATYAKLAANVFALSAAYETLNRAINFGNLIRGSQELGAQVGVDMAKVTKAVTEATRGMVGLPDIMRLSNMAISQGLDLDNFIKLSGLATKVSQVFGRDATDSLNRVVLGVSKLETEFLDELGIMVRVDDLTQRYAKSLGKTKDEITQSTKQQLLFNETIRQLEEKFGNVKLPVNQLEVFSTKMQEVLYNAGSWITSTDSIFNKFLEGLNANPFAIWTVGILSFSKVLKSLVPSLDQVAESQEKLAKQRTDIQNIKRQKVAQAKAIKLAGKAGSSSEIGELANLLNVMDKSKNEEGVALAKAFKNSLFSTSKVPQELVDNLHKQLMDAADKSRTLGKIDFYGAMLDTDATDKIGAQLENLENRIAIFVTKNAKNTSKLKSVWDSAMSSIAGAKSAFTFGLQGERQQFDEQGNLVDISKFSMGKTKSQAIDRMLKQRNEDISLSLANRSEASIRELKKNIETNTKDLTDEFSSALASIINPKGAQAFTASLMQKSTAEQLKIVDSEYKKYESSILNEIKTLQARKSALANKIQNLTSAGYKGAARPYQMQMLDVSTKLDEQAEKQRALLPTKAIIQNRMGGNVADDIEGLNKIDPIIAKMDKAPGIFTKVSASMEAMAGGLGRVIGLFTKLGSGIGWAVLAFEGLRALTKWAASSSIPVLQSMGKAVLEVADSFVKWAESKNLIDNDVETKIKENLEAAEKASRDFNTTIASSIEKINAIPSEKKIDLIVNFQTGLEKTLDERISAVVPALGDSIEKQLEKSLEKTTGGRGTTYKASYSIDKTSELGKLQEDVNKSIGNAAAIGDLNTLTYLQELQNKLKEINKDSNTNDVAKMLWDWQEQLSSSVKSSAELTKNIAGLSKELSAGLSDYTGMLQKLDTYTDKQGRKTLKGDNSAQINDLMAQMGESMGKNIKVVNELSSSVLQLNNSKALDGLISSSEIASAKLADTRTQLQEISAKDRSVNLTAEIEGIESAKRAIDSVVEYARAKSAFIEIAVAMNLGDLAKATQIAKNYNATQLANKQLQGLQGKSAMSPFKENVALLPENQRASTVSKIPEASTIFDALAKGTLQATTRVNTSGTAAVKEPKGKKDSAGGALDNSAYYEREQLLIRLKALQDAYTSSFVEYYQIGKQVAMLEAEDLDRKIKKDGSTQTEIASMKESKTVAEAKSKSVRFLAQDEKILESVIRNTTDAVQSMTSAFSDGLGSLQDYMTAMSLAFGDRILARMQLLKQQGMDTVKSLSLAMSEAANMMAKAKPEAALSQGEAYLRSAQENVAAVRGNDVRKQLDDLKYETQLASLTDQQLDERGGKEAALLQLRIQDLALQKESLQNRYDFNTLLAEESKYAELVASGRVKEAQAMLEGNNSLLQKIQASETLKAIDSQLVSNAKLKADLDMLALNNTELRIKALKKEEIQSRKLIKYASLGSEKAKAMAEVDSIKDPNEKQAFIDTKLAQEEAEFLMKQADELQTRYDDLTNRIGDGFAQAFKTAAESGKVSFKDLFDQVKDWFYQMLADFAKKELLAPMFSDLMGGATSGSSKGAFSDMFGGIAKDTIYSGIKDYIFGGSSNSGGGFFSNMFGGSSSGSTSGGGFFSNLFGGGSSSTASSGTGFFSNLFSSGTSSSSGSISSFFKPVVDGISSLGSNFSSLSSSMSSWFGGGTSTVAGGVTSPGGLVSYGLGSQAGPSTIGVTNLSTGASSTTAIGPGANSANSAMSGLGAGAASAVAGIAGGMIGDYAGGLVAGLFKESKTQEAQMGGMLGSTGGAMAGAMLGAAGGPIGMFIGAMLGAFLGKTAGSLLGGLFADIKESKFSFKAFKSSLNKNLPKDINKKGEMSKASTRTPFGDITTSLQDEGVFKDVDVYENFRTALYGLKDSDLKFKETLALKTDEVNKINDILYSGKFKSNLSSSITIEELDDNPFEKLVNALKGSLKARQLAIYKSITMAYDTGQLEETILRESQMKFLKNAFQSGNKRAKANIENILATVDLIGKLGTQMIYLPRYISDILTKANLGAKDSFKAQGLASINYSAINKELIGGKEGSSPDSDYLTTIIKLFRKSGKKDREGLLKEVQSAFKLAEQVSYGGSLTNTILDALGIDQTITGITNRFDLLVEKIRIKGEDLTTTMDNIGQTFAILKPLMEATGNSLKGLGEGIIRIPRYLVDAIGGIEKFGEVANTISQVLNPTLVQKSIVDGLGTEVQSAFAKVNQIIANTGLTDSIKVVTTDVAGLVRQALNPDLMTESTAAISAAMLEAAAAQAKYIAKLKEVQDPLYTLYTTLKGVGSLALKASSGLTRYAQAYQSQAETLNTPSKETIKQTALGDLQKALSIVVANAEIEGKIVSEVSGSLSNFASYKAAMDALFVGNNSVFGKASKLGSEDISNLKLALEALGGTLVETSNGLKSFSGIARFNVNNYVTELETTLTNAFGNFVTAVDAVLMSKSSTAMQEISGIQSNFITSVSLAYNKAITTIKQDYSNFTASIGRAMLNISGIKSEGMAVAREKDLLNQFSNKVEALQDPAMETAKKLEILAELVSINEEIHQTALNQLTISKEIAQYSKQLALSTFSPKTLFQKFEVAQADFQKTLAKAISGDNVAKQEITGKSEAYLGLAQQFYSSSSKYANIFSSVSASLENLALSNIGADLTGGTGDIVDKVDAAISALELSSLSRVGFLGTAPTAGTTTTSAAALVQDSTNTTLDISSEIAKAMATDISRATADLAFVLKGSGATQADVAAALGDSNTAISIIAKSLGITADKLSEYVSISARQAGQEKQLVGSALDAFVGKNTVGIYDTLKQAGVSSEGIANVIGKSNAEILRQTRLDIARADTSTKERMYALLGSGSLVVGKLEDLIANGSISADKQEKALSDTKTLLQEAGFGTVEGVLASSLIDNSEIIAKLNGNILDLTKLNFLQDIGFKPEELAKLNTGILPSEQISTITGVAGDNLGNTKSLDSISTSIKEALAGTLKVDISETTIANLESMIVSTISAVYPSNYAKSLVDFVNTAQPELIKNLLSFASSIAKFNASEVILDTAIGSFSTSTTSFIEGGVAAFTGGVSAFTLAVGTSLGTIINTDLSNLINSNLRNNITTFKIGTDNYTISSNTFSTAATGFGLNVTTWSNSLLPGGMFESAIKVGINNGILLGTAAMNIEVKNLASSIMLLATSLSGLPAGLATTLAGFTTSLGATLDTVSGTITSSSATIASSLSAAMSAASSATSAGTETTAASFGTATYSPGSGAPITVGGMAPSAAPSYDAGATKFNAGNIAGLGIMDALKTIMPKSIGTIEASGKKGAIDITELNKAIEAYMLGKDVRSLNASDTSGILSQLRITAGLGSGKIKGEADVVKKLNALYKGMAGGNKKLSSLAGNVDAAETAADTNRALAITEAAQTNISAAEKAGVSVSAAPYTVLNTAIELLPTTLSDLLASNTKLYDSSGIDWRDPTAQYMIVQGLQERILKGKLNSNFKKIYFDNPTLLNMWDGFKAKSNTKALDNMTADRVALEAMMDQLLQESVVAAGFPAGSIQGYAMGGIANTPSIFGEAGPEAAVPLPDGRTIPVTINNGSIVDNIVAGLSNLFTGNTNTTEAGGEETTDREMVQELSELRKDIRVLLAAINNSTQEGNKAVIKAISDKFKDNRVLRS